MVCVHYNVCFVVVIVPFHCSSHVQALKESGVHIDIQIETDVKHLKSKFSSENKTIHPLTPLPAFLIPLPSYILCLNPPFLLHSHTFPYIFLYLLLSIPSTSPPSPHSFLLCFFSFFLAPSLLHLAYITDEVSITYNIILYI